MPETLAHVGLKRRFGTMYWYSVQLHLHVAPVASQLQIYSTAAQDDSDLVEVLWCDNNSRRFDGKKQFVAVGAVICVNGAKLKLSP